MNILALDIEANGLYHPWEKEVATKIHCVCAVGNDGREFKFKGKKHLIDTLKEYDILLVHYGLNYDLPMLSKFWLVNYQINIDILNNLYGLDTIDGVKIKIVDTLLLSKMTFPERHVHGLDDWAKVLGTFKPTINDWHNLPLEVYEHRCIEDCKTTLALFKHITESLKGWDMRKAYFIEKAFAQLIYEQVVRGVPFDEEQARKNLEECIKLMQELEDEVLPQLPEKPIPKSRLKFPPKAKFKKTGEPSANARKYFKEGLHEKDGTWYVGQTPLKDMNEPLVTHEPMQMHSTEVKTWLIETYGWKPTFWNYKKDKQGNLIKDGNGHLIRLSARFKDEEGNLCPDLKRLGDKIELVKKIVRWLSLRSRKNVICSDNGTGWLNHPRLAIDGKLPAGMDTVGAITGRVTHSGVANVPRISSLFGQQMRELFYARGGQLVVGCDAKGLEARTEAENAYPYDNGACAAEVLNGDVHTKNMEAFG